MCPETRRKSANGAAAVGLSYRVESIPAMSPRSTRRVKFRPLKKRLASGTECSAAQGRHAIHCDADGAVGKEIEGGRALTAATLSPRHNLGHEHDVAPASRKIGECVQAAIYNCQESPSTVFRVTRFTRSQILIHREWDWRKKPRPRRSEPCPSRESSAAVETQVSPR